MYWHMTPFDPCLSRETDRTPGVTSQAKIMYRPVLYRSDLVKSRRMLYRPDVCNCTMPYVPRTVPVYAERDPYTQQKCLPLHQSRLMCCVQDILAVVCTNDELPPTNLSVQIRTKPEKTSILDSVQNFFSSGYQVLMIFIELTINRFLLEGLSLVTPSVEVGGARVPVCTTASQPRLVELVCRSVGQHCGFINNNQTLRSTNYTGRKGRLAFV